MGRVTLEDRKKLFKLMLCLQGNSYDNLARVLIEIGWCNPTVDQDTLAQDLSALGSVATNRREKRANAPKILVKLLTIGDRFGLRIPTQLILLGKSFLILEGINRKLDPDMDFIKLGESLIIKHFIKYINNSTK